MSKHTEQENLQSDLMQSIFHMSGFHHVKTFVVEKCGDENT